jgi:hypothetical protein
MDKDTVKDRFFKVVKDLRCQDVLQQRETLLEAGFEFFDDDENSQGLTFDDESSEILEEQTWPQTDRQRELVAFFEGINGPSEKILECFLAEKYSDDVNYPLIRRYFRKANSQLKKLIVYGLEQVPWHTDFLSDLCFFNEFKPELKELIHFYQVACRESPNEVLFKEVAKDFYESTQPYGYDAFYALMHDETINIEKKEIVQGLKSVYDELEKAVTF